jgi:hypothetical protein
VSSAARGPRTAKTLRSRNDWTSARRRNRRRLGIGAPALRGLRSGLGLHGEGVADRRLNVLDGTVRWGPPTRRWEGTSPFAIVVKERNGRFFD